MVLPNENRQCPMCDQIVPHHVKGVEINMFGKRRVFHEGCAKLISESYIDHTEEYKRVILDSSSA